MGQFCTKCGRPLQDNEVCNCQTVQQEVAQQTPVLQETTQQAEAQQAEAQQAATQQATPQYHTINESSEQYNTAALQQAASGVLKNVFEIFQNLVKRPVTAGRELILEADIKVAGILILLQAIFSGVFALIVCGKFSTYIKSMESMLGGSLSDFGSLANITGMFKMPYGRIFIVTVLASLALSCFLAGMFWQGHKMIKCQVTYYQMLSAVAIKSALLIPSILVSIILFELKNGLGIFLFLSLTVWGVTAMIVAMSACVNDTIKDKFVLMSSIVLFLFIVGTLFVVSHLWTFYLPDMLRTAINSVKYLIDNPGELINELIKEMM